MEGIQESKKTLLHLLDSSVQELKPDGVLLSGGIDSSALAYLGKKANPDITAITVATNGTESPDVQYAQLVAKELGIKNHLIVEIAQDEIETLIPQVVTGLQNFNMYWVSSATVLFKGLSAAAENGLKSVMTGEGADDLFGTFPVMQSWDKSPEELIDFIATRMKDIDIMTSRMGNLAGVSIALPFHDKDVVDFALTLPLDIRTKINEDGSRVTKHLLRVTFSGVLPQVVVERPQTMAFTGASTLETFMEKFNSQDVAVYREKYGINFSTPFECFLFEIYTTAGLYTPVDDGRPSCLHCKSALRSKESVHCVSCGTLQYKGSILPF